MSAQNPPSFMQNVATETAAQARNLLSALVAPGGIVGTSDMAVSQHSTGNMSVDVAGGAAFIVGTSSTLQGTYHVYSDATLTNLVISTADPTNPRIDTVIAQVQDAFYAGAANAWQYAIVTGTPTSGATLGNLNGKGAVPASSIVLAYVLVPATATSIVTADLLDARARAVPAFAAGGELIGGYAQVTSNQTGITTQADVAGVSVTVTVPAGRKLRITANCLIISTLACVAQGYIVEDGTTVMTFNSEIPAANFNASVLPVARRTPSAGSHTYKLQASVSAGSGTANANAAQPNFILVEDIGPA